MSFFNKFFKNIIKTSQKEEGEKEMDQEDDLSIDELFVKKFIHKGGKFLYCTKKEEITHHLENIIKENNWKEIVCLDKNLTKQLKKIDVSLPVVLMLPPIFSGSSSESLFSFACQISESR